MDKNPYLNKYSEIRKYVRLNIPHNKKLFTTAEKSLITRYHNKLNAMGYFNREQEGYVLKDISHSKYRIKNAPRLKSSFVNVGTRLVDGKITTDTRSKIKIIDGIIYVTRPGTGKSWRFQYNLRKDWTLEGFKKHLIKRLGKNKLKDGQIFAIGAGIYEMRGTDNERLDKLAAKILAIANAYKSQNELSMEEDDEPEIKNYYDFMTEVVVYDSREILLQYRQSVKKRKKKTKYEKKRMR